MNLQISESKLASFTIEPDLIQYSKSHITANQGKEFCEIYFSPGTVAKNTNILSLITNICLSCNNKTLKGALNEKMSFSSLEENKIKFSSLFIKRYEELYNARVAAGLNTNEIYYNLDVTIEGIGKISSKHFLINEKNKKRHGNSYKQQLIYN